MNPDLQHLIQLQQLDSELEAIRRRITEIPVLQEAMDARLAGQQAAVAALKQRVADNQSARRDIEKDVTGVQTRLSKYKDQLAEVKSNKEYQAFQHEITAAQETIRGHEDRILERMEEAESLARELKEAETELARQQNEVVADRKTLGAETGTLEGRASELGATRAGLIGQISPAAMRLFDHVAKSRRGQAVAEARDGVCTVCHVRMRPQVFNEVRRNASLIQCDSCLRILYFAAAPAASVNEQPS